LRGELASHRRPSFFDPLSDFAAANRKMLWTGLRGRAYNFRQSWMIQQCRLAYGKIHLFQCASGDGPSRRWNFRSDRLILQGFRKGWRGMTALASTETSCPVCSDTSARVGVVDRARVLGPAADRDRRAFVPRKVVRLYRNTTEEWLKLTSAEGGEAKELIATPGHHFLDRCGNFPKIEEMLESGRGMNVA
jgi:hypothetical protein